MDARFDFYRTPEIVFGPGQLERLPEIILKCGKSILWVTGISSATKNAVLSKVGPQGFKKSLRHDNYVPQVALIDPRLMLSCPADITASCGMDTFTQLLEAYLSPKSSDMLDALLFDGLEKINSCYRRSVQDGSDLKARTAMAYASLISGIGI